MFFFFIFRLKNLPTEERYIAVKIHSLDLSLSFRRVYRSLEADKLQDFNIPKNEKTDHNAEHKKFPAKMIKAFFQGIVFTSDQDHLDGIGFDFTLIENPQKLFDFLMFLADQKETQMKLKQLIQEKQDFKTLSQKMNNVNSKEELAILVSKILRQQIIPQIISYKENRKLELQKLHKRDFTNTWKNLFQDQKLKLLFLGKRDIKELFNYLEDQNLLLPSPQELQKYIYDLIKAKDHQVCNKVFKSKLKKNQILLQNYHELLYQHWQIQVDKRRKKRNKNKKRIHKCQKQQKIEKIKGIYDIDMEIQVKNPKSTKSIDIESNQTNQTQYHREKQEFYLDIDELTRLKLNEDILRFTNKISYQANQFFDRRVQAFSRIQYLLQKYFQTEIHLFGSLACGLAVQNSDIDIVIDQSFLNRSEFQYLEIEKSKKIGYALEFLGSQLQLRPWIKNVKVISTAAIPIINFAVDTTIPMCEYFMSEEDFQFLNSGQNQGQIDVDLTIQTPKQNIQNLKPMHLGLVSTKKLNQWLTQIEKLQQMTLILKYYLTKLNLNNTYKGGLKTYSLVVLIIAYIKSYNLEKCSSIQTILKGLTKFYGFQFDENVYGIDIKNEKIYYQKNNYSFENQESNRRLDQQSAALEIKDPINGKIMTKSCYSFSQIKKLMRDIYEKCFEQTRFQIQCFCSNILHNLNSCNKIESQESKIRQKQRKQSLSIDQVYKSLSQHLKANYFLKLLPESMTNI